MRITEGLSCAAVVVNALTAFILALRKGCGGAHDPDTPSHLLIYVAYPATFCTMWVCIIVFSLQENTPAGTGSPFSILAFCIFCAQGLAVSLCRLLEAYCASPTLQGIHNTLLGSQIDVHVDEYLAGVLDSPGNLCPAATSPLPESWDMLDAARPGGAPPTTLSEVGRQFGATRPDLLFCDCLSFGAEGDDGALCEVSDFCDAEARSYSYRPADAGPQPRAGSSVVEEEATSQLLDCHNPYGAGSAALHTLSPACVYHCDLHRHARALLGAAKKLGKEISVVEVVAEVRRRRQPYAAQSRRAIVLHFCVGGACGNAYQLKKEYFRQGGKELRRHYDEVVVNVIRARQSCSQPSSAAVFGGASPSASQGAAAGLGT